ncbi:hypothetical protein ARMSODRAFT_956590 [Armillaria solidipes]|uniref:Uncharacterized protein n=1 Tax=Armillaria solidipes TaxID=1076256 RepID=A0A2H3BFZ8_9AGAR|nr:hypothetical protein ARMSODRAFT_956590 [Armillaria solidipes]
MATFFISIFSCCRRKRSKDYIVPNDEEARLILPSTDPLSPAIPNVIVIDHQRLQDKLGTIVRSKEGKMVNVNSQIPFNLHNQPLPQSSLSRSNSHYRISALTMSSSRNYSHSQSHSGSRASSPSGRRTSSNERMDEYRRTPILNVRLVKDYGATATTSRGRKGRLASDIPGTGVDGLSVGSDTIGPESPDSSQGEPCTFTIPDIGALVLSWDD